MRTRIVCAYFFCLGSCFVFAADAIAQQPAQYSLTGNLRFQRENLAIPLSFVGPPTGIVTATPMATVMQTKGPDPRPMVFSPSKLTKLPAASQVALYPVNSNVFQYSSSIGVQWPKAQATFSAGGRTGAATVTFCPGQVVLPGGNPACVGPNGGVQHGLLRYVATANQFGGPGIANISGQAHVWYKVSGTPPCDAVFGAGPCRVLKAPATPPSSFAVGATFGVAGFAGMPTMPDLFDVSAGPAGTINASMGVATVGVIDSATSYGAPWTTGMVTVSTSLNPMGPHVYILTGADARVGGVGSISLVAGGVVNRAVSGPGTQRGWLNLTVPEPRAYAGLAAGLGALFALHVGLTRFGRRG